MTVNAKKVGAYAAALGGGALVGALAFAPNYSLAGSASTPSASPSPSSSESPSPDPSESPSESPSSTSSPSPSATPSPSPSATKKSDDSAEKSETPKKSAAKSKHLGGFGFGFGSDVLDAAAKALGVSADDLREQLAAGKSIADVAKDKGKNLDTVEAAIVAAIKKSLEEKVAEIEKNLPDRVADLVQRTAPDKSMRGPGRGWHHWRGGPGGSGKDGSGKSDSEKSGSEKSGSGSTSGSSFRTPSTSGSFSKA